jgi:hypothetical protein
MFPAFPSEKRALGFDVGQVLLALILLAALVQQPMLAPDAHQGAVAERQIELADEAAGAEGGQSATQGDDLLFQFWGRLVGLVMRSAGTLDEAAPSLLLIAAQPLAHRRDGTLEEAAGGFDALCRAD